MMKTFNCGVGFCLIAPEKCKKNKSFFLKVLSHMKLDIFQKIQVVLI